MPWVAAATMGGSLLSYFGSSKAADAAAQQNAANMAAQQQWNQLVDPFTAGGNRAQYADQLNQLMQGGYGGLQSDPMFQWMQKQGQDQLQRGLSAKGQLGSGNEMLALQQQGYGLAQDFFNQQYNRLADLSGASRGGGQAVMGQSPGAAYQQQYGTTQNQMAALGMGLQGASQLFGRGAGTQAPAPQQQQIFSTGTQSIDPSSGYGGFLSQMNGR